MRRIIAAILAVLVLFSCGAFADTYMELKRGSRDSGDSWAVYSLQARLMELGYLSGSLDGAYGEGTEKAVSNFQMKNALPVTGVADDATQVLLFSVNAVDASGNRATSGQGAETVNDGLFHDIVLGTNNNYVLEVQNRLYRWGFMSDTPDGAYGESSYGAMINFQDYVMEDMRRFFETRYGRAANEGEILDNGVVTQDWYDYIMSDSFTTYRCDIKVGDSGPEVRRMQRRLIALGYSAGTIDGGYGEHTAAAVQYFQRLNGLEQTGIADEPTQMIMYSDLAQKSDKVVTLYKAYVSVDEQLVYIFKWTGLDYTKLVHTFKCSTGSKESPTILGTFQAIGQNGEWYYFEDSDVWAKWPFVIIGGYFFHSTLYSRQDDNALYRSSIEKLGTRASHGCVRLLTADAQWIYENCASGMTVVIYEGEMPY